MKINDPHDRYFRKVIAIITVAQQFLRWFLPKDLKQHLDLTTLKSDDGTYVDKSLNKSISDAVFTCQYKDDDKSTNNSEEEIQQSKIIIFVEHQSTPEKLLVARVYHYVFAMIGKIMQNQTKKGIYKPLPDIYPIVFYNGKTKKYPYSTKLIDCFENRFGIMNKFSQLDIQLININALSTVDDFKHGLAGIMTEAMKRTPIANTEENYLSIINHLGIEESHGSLPKDFTATTIEYMMKVKSIDNLDSLIAQSPQLPQSVRSEAMTTAEAIENRTQTKVAKNMLREGAEKSFVVKTTELPLAKVEELIQKLNNEKNN